MASRFAPTGSEARWKLIYTLLRQHAPGEVVTYDELAAAAELDPRDRKAIHAALPRAQEELLTEDNICLSVVRGRGYRITAAEERTALVRRDQKSALRRIQAGHDKATHVDLNQIGDPTARNALREVGRVMAMQLDFNQRICAKQAKLEEVLKLVAGRSERTEDEVSELRERLARLEGERPA